MSDALEQYSTKQLLEELSLRGGHPGEVANALLLCLRKSEDYNFGKTQNPHDIDRSEYFPFGTVSYAQMIHTKALRFNALTRQEMSNAVSEFEGLRDTAYDLINYAGFYLADQKSVLKEECNE